MFKRMSPGDIIFYIFIIIFMIFIMIITLYPFWHIAVSSISEPFLLAKKTGPILLPQGIDFSSYQRVFDYKLIWSAYKNTGIYVIVGTIVNLIMTTIAAFVLSRRGFKGSGVIMKFIVFTMFFSGGLIPTYLVVDSLGLVNTRLAMIIPLSINAYNFIILRTAFKSVPIEMEEACTIDGGNYGHVFIHIIIPLALPSIMVIGLYYMVAHWNTYMQAVIYLRRTELYPLQIVLRQILKETGGDALAGDNTFYSEELAQTAKYAVIMVATLPIMAVYPFIQKFFIKGVMIGSLKG